MCIRDRRRQVFMSRMRERRDEVVVATDRMRSGIAHAAMPLFHCHVRISGAWRMRRVITVRRDAVRGMNERATRPRWPGIGRMIKRMRIHSHEPDAQDLHRGLRSAPAVAACVCRIPRCQARDSSMESFTRHLKTFVRDFRFWLAGTRLSLIHI